MNKVDDIYKDLLKQILEDGEEVETRNSKVLRKINLTATFKQTPLISVRKTAWKSALREWEWFMSGSSNVKNLHKSVQKWWKPWASEDGHVWNNYGRQFRAYFGWDCDEGDSGCIDQIQFMIDTLKNHPNSRRNVITTWNTFEMNLDITPITSCHGTVIQCIVDTKNKIHMTMYQRSNDMILGYPHNIIQYWAFLMYLASKTGREVGTFTHHIFDAHIYEDHIELAKKIVDSDLTLAKTPELIYNKTSEEFEMENFSLEGEYKPLITESVEMIV